jgi:hypothetical protein
MSAAAAMRTSSLTEEHSTSGPKLVGTAAQQDSQEKVWQVQHVSGILQQSKCGHHV